MINLGIEKSPIINSINSNINRIDTVLNDNTNKVTRLEVLYESMSHKIIAILEIVSIFAESSKNIAIHEARLTEIETKQPMIITTLAVHSKQLKAR